MDAGFNIYELDGEQKKALDLNEATEAIDAAQLAKLEADVARMHGYLKGRADSDRSAHEKLVWDSTTQGTYRGGAKGEVNDSVRRRARAALADVKEEE